MKQSSLPEIPIHALRDYGKGPHIDRGWQRLRGEIGPAVVQRRSSLWWAPALAAVTFGAGVFVGAKLTRTETAPPVVAEPPSAPQRAAGPTAAPVIAPEVPAAPTTTARRRPLPRAPEIALPLEEPAPLPVTVVEEPRDYTPVVPAAPPDWERYADLGDFAAAKSALDAAGGFDAVYLSASPSRLMTLVDIARASGKRDDAVRALRRLLEAYPGADEAPLATWTLANLLDQAGDKAGAHEAYALYRRLSPTGDFAEDAAAREVDIALSQGNVERAAALVEEYARNFPKGRRLAAFKSQLKKLTAPESADGSEATTSVEPEAYGEDSEEPAAAPEP